MDLSKYREKGGFALILDATFSDKFKAKKYKLQEQFLLKKDFVYIMKNLPEEVGRG